MDVNSHLLSFVFAFSIAADVSRLETYTGIPLQEHELQDGIGRF